MLALLTPVRAVAIEPKPPLISHDREFRMFQIAEYNMTSFPYYSQLDPKWGSIEMAPGYSIARYGCLMTSLTMAAHQFGHDLTPDQIVALAQSKHAITTSGEFEWTMLSKLFPDMMFLEKVVVDDGNANDMKSDPKVAVKRVQTLLSRGMPVLLWVDAVGHDGRADHWVLLKDEKWNINDPWHGQVNLITQYGQPETAIKGYSVILGAPADVLVPDATPALGNAISNVAFAYQNPDKAEVYLRTALKMLTI